MNDCNGKRELVTRTRRRAALTSRTTTTNHIQQLCPMNDCRVGSAASVEERTSNQQEHRAFYGQPWPRPIPDSEDLVVPPTESLRFVAGELGKSGRNLEQIGAKFLGPNRFGVFFLNMAERLPTCSRFRAYWKIGSEFGLV